MKVKKVGEIELNKFDHSRIERTIEKMFELGLMSPIENMKDLVRPIADKIIMQFDDTRDIKESGILKAIEREIERGTKAGIYQIKLYRGMVIYMDNKEKELGAKQL